MDTDIVVALITAGVTFSGSYLVFRGQLANARAELAKARTEAEATKRDDDREQMQALWRENRDLRAEMVDQDKRHREEIAELRGATDARMAALEREIETLRGERCPWGRVDCPRDRNLATVGERRE